MKVLIRTLKGGEDAIEVKDASVTVKELKAIFEKSKNISISPEDKFLYKGKTLNDTNTLESYGIQDNDKIHFISRGGKEQKTFWDVLRIFLLKHFSETDTSKIIECMQKEIRHRIYSINLELIEATAIENLKIAEANP